MSSELWALFPVLGFGGIVLCELSVRDSLVEALLRSTIWWATGVWIIANGLSQFSWLQPAVLRGTWLVVGLALVVGGCWQYRKTRLQRVTHWPRLQGWEWVIGAVGGGLLGLTLVTALFAPPVTVDVLNYHLPRQMMWLQQGSLAHFITVNDRELMMPPLAEVIGLQFLALTGNDHWANLPQWVAYALIPLALGQMARMLGLSRRAAMVTGLLFLCLPMAYHEASNAKNDLLGAFWIALLAWRVVGAIRSGKVGRRDAWWVGTTLALAVLTKSTAFLFAPPLMIAGFWFWSRSTGPQAAVRVSFVAGMLCLVLVAPFYFRNWAWYGTPLGVHRAEDGGQQANTTATPTLIASNALRNLSLHLAGPWPAWNRMVQWVVVSLHDEVGLSPEDPRNTLWVMPYAVDYEPRDESRAGAPFAIVVMMLAAVFALLHPRAKSWRWLTLSIGGMVLFYCAVVKWQPWGARLQLPIFALGGLLVMGVTEALFRRYATVAFWILVSLALIVWWPSREDKSRPLWTEPTIFSTSREANQYRYLPLLHKRDDQLAALIKEAGVHSVAIVSIHDITYPLMRSLTREVPGIHFYGAPATDGQQVPGAYVLLEFQKPLPLYYTTHDSDRYRLVGRGLGDGIYLPIAKVNQLDWWGELPDFAGWLDSQNFHFNAGSLMPDGTVASNRYISNGGGWINFRSEGGWIYLSATLVKTQTTAESVELVLNGAIAQRIQLRAEVGFHELKASLPCHPGINRINIKSTSQTGGNLVFTKLRLNDVPPRDQI